jgi:hypothetical protein
MAGILCNKTRIFDTILTEEGRNQIASGKLKICFYSFSDASSVYNAQDQFNSGSEYINLSIEATNNGNDQITFESDDSGKLKVKEFFTINSSSVKIINGKFITNENEIIGNNNHKFDPFVNIFLSKSLENFKNQRIISSPDLFDDLHDEFLLSNNFINFKVTEEKPIPSQKNGGTQDANINNIESLFADKKLSHLPNFKYLPPVNKSRLGSNLTTPLGIYPYVNQEPVYDFKDLQKELEFYESNGYLSEINFIETSKANRIFGQFFEVSDGQLSKLDIIDFGIFTTTINDLTKQEREKAIQESREATIKHVYFAGKLFVDENGSHTFVNLFTIIFEN